MGEFVTGTVKTMQARLHKLHMFIKWYFSWSLFIINTFYKLSLLLSMQNENFTNIPWALWKLWWIKFQPNFVCKHALLSQPWSHLLFTFTQCWWLDKYNLNHSHRFPDMPIDFYLNKSLLCGTLSKAFWSRNKSAQSDDCYTHAWWCQVIATNSCWIVDPFFKNPNCLGVRKLEVWWMTLL